MTNIFSKLIKNNKKHRVKAVHDNDLKQYLKSIGIYNKIISGEIKCKYCGATINIDNLEAIIPNNNKISVVCRNKKCLHQL